MALSRAHVWLAGDLLKAVELNNEINNILNNPITLISPTTGIITFSTSQTFPITQVVTSGGPVVQAASPPRVTGLDGTLSSQTGTFSAAFYNMRTTNGLASWPVTATSAYSASVGTAGPAAGGRDVAAVFASTYVHWYAITTGQFSTAPAAIVSSQAPPTGPVLPAGYTGWTYLGGSVYTSASTTVAAPHSFRGDWAFYHDNLSILAVGTATSFTNISISSAFPTNALNFGARIAQGAAVAFSLAVVAGSTYIAFQSIQQDIYVALPVTGILSYANGLAGGNTNVLVAQYQMPNL